MGKRTGNKNHRNNNKTRGSHTLAPDLSARIIDLLTRVEFIEKIILCRVESGVLHSKRRVQIFSVGGSLHEIGLCIHGAGYVQKMILIFTSADGEESEEKKRIIQKKLFKKFGIPIFLKHE